MKTIAGTYAQHADGNRLKDAVPAGGASLTDFKRCGKGSYYISCVGNPFIRGAPLYYLTSMSGENNLFWLCDELRHQLIHGVRNGIRADSDNCQLVPQMKGLKAPEALQLVSNVAENWKRFKQQLEIFITVTESTQK